MNDTTLTPVWDVARCSSNPSEVKPAKYVLNMKIELHTKDGQVLFAQVESYPSIGECVVSDDGDSYMISDPGHAYKNYPFRMYKVTPYAGTPQLTTTADSK